VKNQKKQWDGDGVPLKDSNCALIGSDEDKAVRKNAAMTEAAWQGCGAEAGVEVWRIEDFKVVAWPKEKYGTFFTGDSYIVLSTTKEPETEKLLHDIHFWLGKESTADEMGTAAYKTVELDDLFDGEPVQHREVQHYESEDFKELFPKLEYKKGGKASGFRKSSSAIELYEHKLWQVRKTKKEGMRMEDMALHNSSLNEGDVFILDAGDKIYVWEGKKSSPFEKNHANMTAEKMEAERDGKSAVTHDIDDFFWSLLGGQADIKGADDVSDETRTPKAEKNVLYQITDASGALHCVEVGRGQLNTAMLKSEDVMMLVIEKEVFLWVGSGASTAEGRSSYRLAMDWLKVNNKPMHTPIHLFKEGQAIRNDLWKEAFDAFGGA